MTNQQTIDKIFNEVYNKMYREAEPPLDFEKAKKTGLTKEKDWFLTYFLNQDRQDEIIEEVLKKHNLRKHEKDSIRRGITLGCAPNGWIGMESVKRKVTE